MLDIETHFKPTETFQYTHCSGCHPLGVKKGFIKGEALILLRTNSSENEFKSKISHFRASLIERGYPESLITATLSDIKFEQLLCTKMLTILKIKTRRMHCRVTYKHAEFCFWNTRECRKCREYLLAVSECFSYFSIIRKNFQMLILLNIKQSFREII